MSDKQFPPPEALEPHGDHDHAGDSAEPVDPVVELDPVTVQEDVTVEGDHPAAASAPEPDVAGNVDASGTVSSPENKWHYSSSMKDDRAVVSVIVGGVVLGAVLLAGAIGFSIGQSSGSGNVEGVCQSTSVWGSQDPHANDTPGHAKFEARFQQGDVNACVGGVVDGLPNVKDLVDSGVNPMMMLNSPQFQQYNSPSVGTLDVPSVQMPDSGVQVPDSGAPSAMPEIPTELIPLLEQYLSQTSGNSDLTQLGPLLNAIPQ